MPAKQLTLIELFSKSAGKENVGNKRVVACRSTGDSPERKRLGITIFPPRSLIFNAFNLTPFNEIKVVLLGQDPYHNLSQAHGLCFSVPQGTPPPPSLKNIYKELSSEFPDFKIPTHGELTCWAKQGIFMLNATLTVEAHKPNSHSNIGWQIFTDSVIKLISSKSNNGVVFLLWGGFAHRKEMLVDKSRHRVIKTAHPSPLSVTKFFGSKCFSKTNDLLKELGREPIDWNVVLP
uniref:Uracil-DNA glycosylase n=1 Tax=Meloidogyne javanica TaxID=6303 RepID=A0A915MW56_MELJA